MKKIGKNKILMENFRRWLSIIKECDYTINKFCHEFEINRRSFYNSLNNPTIKTLEEIENAIVEMKKQHKKD